MLPTSLMYSFKYLIDSLSLPMSLVLLSLTMGRGYPTSRRSCFCRGPLIGRLGNSTDTFKLNALNFITSSVAVAIAVSDVSLKPGVVHWCR